MSTALPWYIAGPLIGLIVPVLLIVKEKQFGISSSYRFLGSFILPKISYFNYDRKNDRWQFHFAIGLILAGIASTFLHNGGIFTTSSTTTDYGKIALGIYKDQNILFFFVSGIFVGFGARYANGCTAGHCIMGASQFSLASIVSTVGFFIGGLFATYFVIPFIF